LRFVVRLIDETDSPVLFVNALSQSSSTPDLPQPINVIQWHQILSAFGGHGEKSEETKAGVRVTINQSINL
jgi:hypothetical protein